MKTGLSIYLIIHQIIKIINFLYIWNENIICLEKKYFQIFFR